QQVQPLTRVWCLFEFFLSSRENLELVFGTDAGVIGDDGCTSFDIALEVGKKIKSLQVVNCQTSSEKDKKDIFDYIVSELGSLERMDEQIRSLIGKMLKKNLTNVGHATDSLLHELGQI
ncbi:Putative outer membrane protein PmpB, partial [Durusdinium trenchii]